MSPEDWPKPPIRPEGGVEGSVGAEGASFPQLPRRLMRVASEGMLPVLIIDMATRYKRRSLG